MNTQTTSTVSQIAIKWGKRIAIVILVMMGLGYGVLSLAQRSKEPIRMGLEDYLEQVTGHDAEITNLVTARLVPDVTFDMDGVLLRDRTDSQKSLMKAQHVSIAMPLSGILLGRSQYYAFNAKGLEIASGYVLPKKIALDYAGISQPDPALGEAYFVLDGLYNEKPVLITAEMIVDSNGKKPLYRFHDEFPVTFKIGPVEGSGRYVRGWSGIDIKDGHITLGRFAADFEVKDIKSNPLVADIAGMLGGVTFKGALREEAGKTALVLYPDEASDENIRMMESFAESLKEALALTDTPYNDLVQVKEFSKE